MDMAEEIRERVQDGTADRTNPALKKVLGLRDHGLLFILSRRQPLAFTILDEVWCVREGVHRSIAVALIGARELEGINLLSVRQAAG